MVLNDMGNEYYCYSSDITVSFPVSGTFTPEQRGIYEAVLDATLKVVNRQKLCICLLCPSPQIGHHPATT